MILLSYFDSFSASLECVGHTVVITPLSGLTATVAFFPINCWLGSPLSLCLTTDTLSGSLTAFKMLPYSTFINTGRGAQVVEDDLAEVLKKREDITAILDVTFPEPPQSGHPFYTLPNCFLTTHIAGSLGYEMHRMSEYMKDEMIAYINQKETKYEVTLKMLETMA